MELLNKIVKAGVLTHYPDFLQRKIEISNRVALNLFFFVALPFVVVSQLYFQSIVLVPIMGSVVIAGSIFLNYLNLVYLSRSILSVVPIALAATYNAALAMEGEPPVTGIYLIELSFLAIPFLVFDVREKAYLFISGAVSTIIMLSFDYTNAWWEISLDTTIIRTGFVAIISTITAIALVITCILSMVYQNKAAEEKTARLLEKANANHQKAQASEQRMEENLKQLERAQEEEKKRQWVTEGLTTVAQLIRDHDRIEELADHLLSFTIQYVKANQGGLFVIQEQDDTKVLELVAAYAYERKKYLQKQFELGQGLLGQACLEKQYQYFTKVPDNYLTITSGLGAASPTALLIMPLMINDEVEGVLELASFHKFASHEINFLEKLGESLAAALRNGRLQQQTQILLENARQQAEEMQATEEEMRQNMEELAATQEEMQRKEQEYLKQLAAYQAQEA